MRIAEYPVQQVVQEAEQRIRYVYGFDEAGRRRADLLGGKGANLAEMTRLGLPVPPGFTITTDACRATLAADGEFPGGMADQVIVALGLLERATGRGFGDDADPLLLSVRSGAPRSMPGMMDTILNVGLNDASVAGLIAVSGDERFAWDAYRRLVQLYGKVVLGAPGEIFEDALARLVAERGHADETSLTAEDLRGLTATFQGLVRDKTGEDFPQRPGEQLEGAIAAVLRSWNGRRARDYRRMEGISDDLGTAVNVQAMVFGNLGADSGTGVVFTRDPATGAAHPYGDWLRQAQGEDVVAGIRLTRHLDDLAERFPECHRQLLAALTMLEWNEHDMCDVEFTIERGTLWILQTRVGKRTAQAAVRMAVDMVGEGLIDEREAVLRVQPSQLERLLHPQLDPAATIDPIATGLAASPGAAVGEVCFDSDEAERRAAAGRAVILVRAETSPDDLHGMIAAGGILTARGGLVSHAAVVARGMGKPAVCGVEALHVDVAARRATIATPDGDVRVADGDVLAIDGTSGVVVLGAVPLVTPAPPAQMATLLRWADRYRQLGVRANADLPADVVRAVALGAEGIGLCRTEHQFLGDRLPLVQRAIFATGGDSAELEAALAALRQVQVADFTAMLRAAAGRPLTVRLLDPPLHEFLPPVDELLVADARGELDGDGRRLLRAAQDWREVNPMLGIRGCRLGLLVPGLYRMQAEALAEAAVAVHAEGIDVRPELMIPLVSDAAELRLLAAEVRDAIDGPLGDAGIGYRIGTMIETPRAALTAAAIAPHADFFSFGTNDLTQLTWGLSRDDVEVRLLPAYERAGVLTTDPFRTLDAVGVGPLIARAVEDGRAARPGLETGVCGEHGGDPASIRILAGLGVDYVSCSPYRVPVARLSAAHAALT